MTRLWWARHGQSEANVSHTFSHRRYDPPLTELGRREAADLARRVAALDPTAVYCSPMLRARQTAAAVTEGLGLADAVVLEGLRELDVGSLDGRRDEAGWRRHDEVLSAWREGDRGAAFPDGEDLDGLLTRLRGALDVAGGAAEAASGPILVVAHGGNLLAALTAWGVQPEEHLGTARLVELELRRGPDGVLSAAAVGWDL
jgi:probable phosphoglycerate mutase